MLFLNHIRNLWGNWWILPLLPIFFVGVIALLGDLRAEHVVAAIGILILAVSTPTTKGLLLAGMPGIAIGMGYELIRYIRPAVVESADVLGCGLQSFEAAIFPLGQGRTLADYFAEHHSTFWDVFFAIPYTFFWLVAVVYVVTLYFINRKRMHLFLWILAGTHALAFVIWLVFPAAPPWYIQAHGCAIDLAASPNAAGLLRLDALFDTNYSENFYSRSPFVFGALPSLHCAFPIAGLIATWRDAGWGERSVHFLYTIWMWAASVYLTHHWVVDGLVTLGLAVIVFAVLNKVFGSFFSSPSQHSRS